MEENKKIKLLLLLIIVVFTLPARAQKINIDNVGSDGVRTTVTESVNCKSIKDKSGVSVSLAAIIMEGDTLMTMNFHLTSISKIDEPKDGKVLVKLLDGTVLTLDTDLGDSERIGKSTGTEHKMMIYRAFIPCKVTKDDVNSIISKGVSKIRIELSNDSFEKEYPKEMIGDAVEKLYPVLLKTVSEPKSFDTGF